MKRGSGIRPEESWRWAAALAVALCSVMAPTEAQEPEKSKSMFEGVLHLEPENDEMDTAQEPRRGMDIPYAVVAVMQLDTLAVAEEAGLTGEWAKSVGLNAESHLVQELSALAIDLERQHPRGLIPEDREELLRRFSGDDEGLRLWSEARRTRRYRAAGSAFGRWLQARGAEGYPAEFLIERLLSRNVALIAHASRSIAQNQRVNIYDFQVEATAFEEGISAVMDPVPERFRFK